MEVLNGINAMTDVAAAINEYKRRKDLGKTFLNEKIAPNIKVGRCGMNVIETIVVSFIFVGIKFCGLRKTYIFVAF